MKLKYSTIMMPKSQFKEKKNRLRKVGKGNTKLRIQGRQLIKLQNSKESY